MYVRARGLSFFQAVVVEALMTARSISIGPDKFLLVPGQEGSISHQTLSKFRELYGLNTVFPKRDENTIAIFAKLFGADVSKAEQEQRISALTADEKSRLLTALDKRIRDMNRDLQPIQAGHMTLGSSVVMNKLSKLKVIRDAIAKVTPGVARSGLTGPSVTDVLENEIVQVPVGADAEPTAVAHAKMVRTNLFQRIMIIAYYLAHPVQLHRRDPLLYDALRKLVDDLSGPKTPAQLTKMVTMIQQGATSADIRSMDPLNYFERVSMSDFLESPDLATGATNTIINPLKESTQEKIMASYVTKLMALLQIEGTVDEARLKSLKECLKGEGACIDKGRRAKGVEMGQKLTSAIAPLYEAFSKMYSPLFGQLDDYIRVIQPIPAMEIMRMLKIFTNEQLPDGIYKCTNVPANVMEFFNKINTNYSVIQQYVSQLKLKSTNKIQAVYLHDNLPIPNTTGQIVFKQVGGGNNNTTKVVNPVAQLLQERSALEASAKTPAKSASAKPPASASAKPLASASAKTPAKTPAKSATQPAKSAPSPATPATPPATPAPSPATPAQQTIIRLTEPQKQELLNKVKTFFADKENTLYIMSGKELTQIPIALFTVPSESKVFSEISTPEYENKSMKVGNVFPSISNSKPVLIGAVMLAGFIAFAKSLNTIADEPAPAPAAAPAPVPTPAPAPGGT